MAESRLSTWFQEIMLYTILGAVIYFAVAHNDSRLVDNLVTLCFGYYFGQRGSNPPPPKQ